MAALLAMPAAHAGDDPTAGLQAAGAGRLTFLGLRAYDARLWVAPGFRAGRFAEHAFVLELQYHRALRGDDIARRSIDEIARAGPLDAAQAQRWQEALRQVFPDVRPGDRIAGVHRPGQDAAVLVNGRSTGTIDARLAERFFGIWLAPTTSEPQLRRELLANTAP
jgi:hypothetical protein